ncbi:prenyltransferase/squalene oxidase repeat-containing protein [Thermococcus sp. Bubb.Bath]|uniref:prenyltransferase/squalene oxidase repeat-containing protein n=1 Tax=Thermococcus sp. Bubb.Bath TaxID=1638242 RepID=UPI00143BCA35|nr:prenyltransferase/squalene oxidase repeat-containing protein [Thermococcus sp. Bubb.Bath]NJF25534.1 prenyltransferase [Thermococcus sp. Bubb.Bath]
MRGALNAFVIILITIVTLSPLAAAVSINDGSANFLKNFGDSTGQIRHLSLAIIALSEAKGKVRDDPTPKIREFTRELLSCQNPDGGWGYFNGSVSNVLETSYAVVALKEAEPFFEGTSDYWRVDNARKSGINFILSSRTGKAWGYVSGTSPMFYPTVMALWALGKNGYTVDDPEVADALSVLSALPMYIDNVTALGLKLIALKAVGASVENSSVETVMNLLQNGSLSPQQRAILTYAATLYSKPTFELVADIARLDEIKHTGRNNVFWADTPKYPMSITDTITPTAYALMAISELVPPIESVSVNPNEMPCDELLSYQNPDGGWGLRKGLPSNEMATYYALQAVEACYPAPQAVERAINWTKDRLAHDESEALKEGRMTVDYYYALMTLVRFNALNESERAHAIQVIKSLKLKTGLWGEKDLGPQPGDTARAISALLALGVSPSDGDIKAAEEWLTSISSKGWGLYYASGLYGYMLDMNVLDTITVLKALEPLVNESTLRPHLKWLLNQKVDGGWAYVKKNYIWSVNFTANGTPVITSRAVNGTPTVFLTVEAATLLMKHGMGHSIAQEALDFVRSARDSGKLVNDTLDTAAAIIYLSGFNRMPMVDLSDVRNALESSTFAVEYAKGRMEDASSIRDYLIESFGQKFLLGPLGSLEGGNYVVVAGFNDVNVSEYNRYLDVEVNGNTITVDGKPYPREGTVLLAPGRTKGGVILFVLYDKDSSEIAKLVFRIGYVKYMQGNAVVIRFQDRNGDGKVQLNEVTAEVAG